MCSQRHNVSMRRPIMRLPIMHELSVSTQLPQQYYVFSES